MKKLITTLIILTALFPFGVLAQEKGELLFSDDFENFAMALENWRPAAGGSKIVDGKANLGAWELKQQLPLNFRAEADFIFNSLKNPQGNTHIGFDIDGIRFVASPRGTIFPMCKIPALPIEGFEIGKPFRLEMSRTCNGRTVEYIFIANGKEVDRQIRKLPEYLTEKLTADNNDAKAGEAVSNALGAKSKPLYITSYGADAVADNFSIFKLKGERESRNRVLNGSFEHLDQDGFPYYVFRGNGNMFDLTSDTLPYEKQIANWCSDNKVFHSGGHSIRMTYEKGLRFQCLWIWGLIVVKDQPATLSVYLKADQPDFPVTMHFAKVKKEIKVGTEWERYELTNPKMPFSWGYIPMSITFKEREGTLWVDDLQIEIGDKATPFHVSALDKVKLSKTYSGITPRHLWANSTYTASGGLTITVNNPNSDEWKGAAELVKPSTEEKITSQEVVLSTGKNDIVFQMDPVPQKIDIQMVRKGTTELRQTLVRREPQPLSIVSRFNYYMNESEATFRASTLLPNPDKLTAELECDGHKVKVPAAAKFEIKLPLKDIPDGTHKVTMDLLKNDVKVASATTDIIKRPYRRHATQINQFSRCLVVDGKPFFPISPCYVWQEHPGIRTSYDPEYAGKFIDFWMKRGFKSLDIVSESYKGSVERKGAINFLKAANEKGLKVMLWTKFLENKPEDWPKLLSIYNQPCVITHRVEDEADLRMDSDELRDFIDTMRPFMPYVPTYMSYTHLGIARRSADLTPDILMCDPYLTNSGWFKPVEDVLCHVDNMYAQSMEMNKPVFVFLIGRNAPNHWREITGVEQIAQSYGSVCAGATGLTYFIEAPTTLPHWNALMKLNREFQALTDVICSDEETAQAVPSILPFRSLTKKLNGYLYVISVNTDENPRGKVTFTLPANFRYDDNAEVMFENRKLKVKDGKFTDEFPGHERHVYKIKLK